MSESVETVSVQAPAPDDSGRARWMAAWEGDRDVPSGKVPPQAPASESPIRLAKGPIVGAILIANLITAAVALVVGLLVRA